VLSPPRLHINSQKLYYTNRSKKNKNDPSILIRILYAEKINPKRVFLRKNISLESMQKLRAKRVYYQLREREDIENE